MFEWERIRSVRPDLTDYVIHLTRGIVELPDRELEGLYPFDRLKDILKSGYIRRTFAHRRTASRNFHRTIRGDHPATCFTEQPLDQVLPTFGRSSPDQGYGIALNKVDLYNYGGRPVIYGDDELLAGLPPEAQYLWVRYRPVMPGEPAQNDFTHEREWRCRLANLHETLPCGDATEGVPVLLPDDLARFSQNVPPAGQRNWWEQRHACYPDFRIIVRWDKEVQELREFIEDLKARPGSCLYHRGYYAALRKAQIISLQHVECELDQGGERCRRVEDLLPPSERRDVVGVPPRRRAAESDDSF